MQLENVRCSSGGWKMFIVEDGRCSHGELKMFRWIIENV